MTFVVPLIRNVGICDESLWIFNVLRVTPWARVSRHWKTFSTFLNVWIFLPFESWNPPPTTTTTKGSCTLLFLRPKHAISFFVFSLIFTTYYCSVFSIFPIDPSPSHLLPQFAPRTDMWFLPWRTTPWYLQSHNGGEWHFCFFVCLSPVSRLLFDTSRNHSCYRFLLDDTSLASGPCHTRHTTSPRLSHLSDQVGPFFQNSENAVPGFLKLAQVLMSDLSPLVYLLLFRHIEIGMFGPKEKKEATHLHVMGVCCLFSFWPKRANFLFWWTLDVCIPLRVVALKGRSEQYSLILSLIIVLESSSSVKRAFTLNSTAIFENLWSKMRVAFS